jgi:hypothetical protein
MSTPVTTDGHLNDAPNFCKSCGSPLAGGRFCPDCGQAITGTDDHITVPHTLEELEAERERVNEPIEAPVDDVPTEVHAPRREAVAPRPQYEAQTPAAPRKGGMKPALVAGLLVGLVLIAGAIAAVIVLGSKSDTKPPADTVYRQKIASAMGPVLGANKQASDTLSHLRGKKVKSSRASDARIAVARAQRAVTLATGAVGAMTIPSGSEQLARDTRQVLDRERAYYADVARVLKKPASESTNGLQESASDLTSALSIAGPTVMGNEPTVSGTSRLVNWATIIRKAQSKRKATKSDGTTSTTTTVVTPPITRSTPGGQSCGDGVFAGPNTSCPFAFNTRDAYNDAPGSHATVRVFSPVTDTTYTMSCAPSGDGVTCSGGNDASVTF